MKKIFVAFSLSCVLLATACSSKEKETKITANAVPQTTSDTQADPDAPASEVEPLAPTETPFQLSTESEGFYISPEKREAYEKENKSLKNVPKNVQPFIMRGAKPYLLLGDASQPNGYTIRYTSSKDYDETIAFLRKEILAEKLQDASLLSEVSGAGLSTWSYAGFLSDGNILHLIISTQRDEDVNVYIIVDPPQ